MDIADDAAYAFRRAVSFPEVRSGDFLARLRLGTWMSREWLAEAAKVSVETILEWEDYEDPLPDAAKDACLRWLETVEHLTSEILEKIGSGPAVTWVVQSHLGLVRKGGGSIFSPRATIGLVDVSVADSSFALHSNAVAGAREHLYQETGAMLVAYPWTEQNHTAYQAWLGGRQDNRGNQSLWMNGFARAAKLAGDVDEALVAIPLAPPRRETMSHNEFWRCVRDAGFDSLIGLAAAVGDHYEDVAEEVRQYVGDHLEVDEALGELGGYQWVAGERLPATKKLKAIPPKLAGVVKSWTDWADTAAAKTSRLLYERDYLRAASNDWCPKWVFFYAEDEVLHELHPHFSKLPAAVFVGALQRAVQSCDKANEWGYYFPPRVEIRSADFRKYYWLWRVNLPDTPHARAAYVAEMSQVPDFMVRLEAMDTPLPTTDAIPWLEKAMVTSSFKSIPLNMKLREIRQSLGLSIYMVATILGLNAKTLMALEQGCDDDEGYQAYWRWLRLVVQETVCLVDAQATSWNAQVMDEERLRMYNAVVYASDEEIRRFDRRWKALPAVVHRYAMESLADLYGFMKLRQRPAELNFGREEVEHNPPVCVEMNVKDYLEWLGENLDTLEVQRWWVTFDGGAHEDQGEGGIVH